MLIFGVCPVALNCPPVCLGYWPNHVGRALRLPCSSALCAGTFGRLGPSSQRHTPSGPVTDSDWLVTVNRQCVAENHSCRFKFIQPENAGCDSSSALSVSPPKPFPGCCATLRVVLRVRPTGRRGGEGAMGGGYVCVPNWASHLWLCIQNFISPERKITSKRGC